MRRVSVFITMMLMLTMLTGCLFMYSVTEFSGSRASNDELFDLDFDMLNRKEEHHMTLKEGDTIKVTADHKSGKIDVFVSGPSDTIYQGDDIEDMEFFLTIEEDGIYTFEVSGDEGIGSVCFELVKDEEL